jgi:hypothetical protein
MNLTKKSWRAALAGVMVAGLGSIALSAPAEAAVGKPEPRLAVAQDQYVRAQCRFTVTSVNYSTGVLRGRLTTTTNGFYTVVAGSRVAHVATSCYLYDGNFTFQLAAIADEANGPYTYESEIVTVPLFASYGVLEAAAYTLRNGNTGVLFASDN